MKNAHVLLLGLCCFTLSACAYLRTIDVPSSDDVSEISVSVERDGQREHEQYVIRDRDRIASLLGFISDHNTGWAGSWLPRPVYPIAAGIKTYDGKTPVLLLLSKHKASACQGSQGERACYYWWISKPLVSELLLLLKIDV
jgi:hypothetical protein